jgi:glutathionylspermidine synthase
MRTLTEQLLEIGERRYKFAALALNDHAAITDGLIESRVQGQLYAGLNALVLTPREKAELEQLTLIFARIMDKAMGQIATRLSTAELEALGWPEMLAYALKNEPLNRWLTSIGRFDFALDTRGVWQLMEFNSDTPSGAQEVTLVEERAWKILRHIDGIARLNPAIGEKIIAAIRAEALYPPVPIGFSEMEGPLRLPKVGFVVRGRYLTDLAQVIYYANGLRQSGLECVVGDPNNLALIGNRLYLCGQPIDAIYRLYPIEFLSREPIFAAYMQTNLMGALKCINNLRGFLAQSKSVLAWIWGQRENTNLFTAEERKAIQNHLPETHLLQDLPASFDRSPFIIKEFYGREGAEVYDGSQLDAEGWEECRKWRTFVAQRRIDIAPHPHIWLNAPNWEIEQQEVFPCVGSFIIGGEWGGCYTRVGGRITTSQAQFIPTLVEE